MKKSSLFLFILMSITGLVPLTAEESLQPGNTAYVTVSVLNYRDQPSIKGNKKGAFLLAEKGRIVKKSAAKEQIGNKEDYWYFITSSNKQGWVFGAFLSATPVLTKQQLQQTLSGTYYYGKNYKVNQSSNILTLKDDTFKEKRFYGDGSYTEFTGNVVYQAHDILLVPTVKIFHATEYQKSAYGKNYHNTDRPIKLRLKEQKTYQKKYYIITCSGKQLLSLKETECFALGEVYFQK